MASVKVKSGQTLLDVALRYAGSAEAVYRLAKANGLTITEKLQVGRVIQLGESVDERNVVALDRRAADPAANLDAKPPQGIGYWTIGENFKVS